MSNSITSPNVQIPNQNARPCPAKFYMKGVYNKQLSDTEGRPIYEDVPFIKIFVSRNTVHDRVVKDEDKFIYSSQWERFQKNEEQIPEGTRVEAWGILRPSQIELLKSLKLFCVEDIAAAREDLIKTMGPNGRELVAKAKAYLQMSKDGALVHKQAEEIERLKESDLENKETIKFLSEKIQELEQSRKKR